MDKKIVTTRPYDNIKDVDESKDVWQFAVRVVDVWPVVGKSRQEQLDLVVVDKQNDMIHITIPNEELREWKGKLKQNKSYEMNNFKVMKNDITFKACTHPYRLVVTGATIIEEVDFPDIAVTSIKFKDFAEILAGNYRTDLLTDVIGAFQEVTNTNRSQGRIKSVTFVLKDTSGHMIHVCMWDDFAKQFYESFDKEHGQDTIFIVVKHGRIKAAHSIYPLCVTNTWSGTQIIVNDDIPEIRDFKARFVDVQSDDSNPSLQLSQFSQSSYQTENSDIMSNTNFLTLSEVNHVMHQTNCVTVAEIKKLNANKFGWTYEACRICNKSVKMEEGKLMCDKKHINENPIVRYRVEVQVVHKDDKANFLLWDNHVTSIVGITAAELKEELIKVGKYHPKMYPPVLDQLISPKRVWKIKAMPGSNPFSVIQFSDNEQLLKNLEKQFGLEEASSKLAIAGPSFATNDKDGSKVNTAADDNNGETENSQSLCGENDPTSTLATPPPKRRSQDEVDLVAYSQDIEATQLSSTKLAKQPKLEPKN